jgi:hypothetical protein
MFLSFIQKVLDSAILNRHKIKPSLPQLKKKKQKNLCSPQDEHVEWNANILGNMQDYTAGI